MNKVGTVLVVTIFIAGFGIGDVAAQSDLGFKGVGVNVGFANSSEEIEGSDESAGSGIIFGGHVHLGEVIPGLAIVPSVDYWKTTQDVPTQFGTVEVDFTQLAINGNVRYYFPTNGNFDVFALGGLAWVRGEAEAQGQSFDDSAFGVNVGGGAEIPLSENLVGTALAKYVTEGKQIKIMGGVRFLLGQ